MVSQDPSLRSQPIAGLLEAGFRHGQTIRYNPMAGPDSEVSHVYMPFALTFEGAPILSLTVSWN